MRFMLVAGFLLLTSCVAVHGQNDNSDDQEEQKDRIYQWIGDLSADRDELVKRGYAVMIDGVLIEPSTLIPTDKGGNLSMEIINVPVEYSFQRVYVRRGNDFDYRAVNNISARESWSNAVDRQNHRWLEYLDAKTTIFGRELVTTEPERFASNYLKRPDDKPVGQWYQEKFTTIASFTPYDSFVTTGAFLQQSGYRPVPLETMYLERMNLEFVSPELGGLTRSQWAQEVSIGNLVGKMKTQVMHDPGKRFMPTEVTLAGSGEIALPVLNQHLRMTDWKKVNGFWLPHVIEQIKGLEHANRELVCVAKLRWLVGKEVPDAAFDPKSEDLRQPILDHFGVDFMRIEKGRLLAAPLYEVPEDLIKAFQSEK